MLKEKRNFSKNSLSILTSFLFLALCACSSMSKIPKPEGPLCIHDQPTKRVPCTQLQSGEEILPEKTIDETDGYIMMPIATYDSIQTYIDRLKQLLLDRTGGEGFLMVKIRVEDLEFLPKLEERKQVLLNLK